MGSSHAKLSSFNWVIIQLSHKETSQKMYFYLFNSWQKLFDCPKHAAGYCEIKNKIQRKCYVFWKKKEDSHLFTHSIVSLSYENNWGFSVYLHNFRLTQNIGLAETIKTWKLPPKKHKRSVSETVRKFVKDCIKDHYFIAFFLNFSFV